MKNIDEVLEELAEAQFNAMNFKAELDELTFRKNTSDAAFKLAVTERDTLQSKVDSQAREIERLNEEEHKSQLHLERACRSRDTLAAKIAAMESQRVYLVCTGEVHNGEETYTRYDYPPALADFETLYSLAPGAAPKVEPDCEYCYGMGIVDGVGEACNKCNGTGAAQPPSPAAQPLSDDQIAKLHRDAYTSCGAFTTLETYTHFARAIEAAHGIGKEQQA